MNRTVIDLASLRSVCQQCGIYKLCMPIGLSHGDMDMLDRIIKRRRPLERGQHLYQAGEPFHSFFALRSGSLKTYVMDEEGEESVIGFKMPGDLLGLSDLDNPAYTRSAKALETCSVCEIPYDRYEELSQEIPGLQHHIMAIMSKEIHQEQDKVAMCRRMSAEARLASLLLTLSERFAQRGFSPSEFNLSMSRSDIANMLGLAVETVSRLFTQFQEQGLLEVERKHIQLHNFHGLAEMVTNHHNHKHSTQN